MDDNKTEKKITLDIEPFRPVMNFLYRCENKFHSSCLNYLLEDDEKFGFIIVDGGGALFATLQGNVRNIIQKITVELPKKHGRGGQSANRFASLREEKRHTYVVKVAELATQNFITNDRPNVKGIIMAGSADFKTVIGQSDLFDKRLQAVIIATFDISYGGENGLSQAITQSGDALANVRYMEEKKLVTNFFTEISLDTGMIVFGVNDTMKALDLGAVKTVLLFEDITHMRYVIKNPVNGKMTTYFLTPAQEEDPKYFKDADSGIDLDIIESEPLCDWLCVHYGDFGCKIELISDKTQEGYQFVKGFGGLAGMLRYKVDMEDHFNDDGQLGGDEFDAEEDFI
jgi:peptide chain release factor subunit 1